jgi:hypothetical protein
MKRFMIPGILLVLSVALFRLLPIFLGVQTDQPNWFINVSPMSAVILCGAACLPRRWALTLPFAVLLGTDLLLTAWYPRVSSIDGTLGAHAFFNVEFVAKTLAFAALAYFGWQLRNQARARVLLPVAIGGSFFFYLVTNTASWMYEPAYAKTFFGWTQALTTGLPQYQPTWMFYQNQFISDVVFTLLFLACVRPSRAVIREEQAAAAAW